MALVQFPFSKEVPNYQNSSLETPYCQAQQDWDFPIGYWTKKAYIWRLLSYCLVVASLILLALLADMLYLQKDRVIATEILSNGQQVDHPVLLQDQIDLPDAQIKTILTGLFMAGRNRQQNGWDQAFGVSDDGVVHIDQLSVDQGQLTANVTLGQQHYQMQGKVSKETNPQMIRIKTLQMKPVGDHHGK